MTYEELISTITSIITDETIITEGLSLTYVLNEKNHKAMHEIIFYKSHPITENPILTDVFEVDIHDINVKFIKKE
tara:strand:- start:21057 stop:21281 length:225 start_codon:yes stop_codon:yes gene_type:complete